jgi:hypothetical protein
VLGSIHGLLQGTLARTQKSLSSTMPANTSEFEYEALSCVIIHRWSYCFRSFYLGTFMMWRVHGFVLCCVLSLNTTFSKCFIHFLLSSLSFRYIFCFGSGMVMNFFRWVHLLITACLISTCYTDIIIRIVTLLQIWMV